MPRIDKFEIREVPYGHASVMPPEGVIEVVVNGSTPEAVAFCCPCGCGQKAYLPLARPGTSRATQRPLWDYRTNGNLINPSVLYRSGCGSHFFIREDGTVKWC